MFSLAYGLWKYIFNKTEFHVLILGVDKAGKTTLLEKIKSIYLKGEGLTPDRIVPTVGLNIGRIEDANAKLVFWDLGGQVGLRTIWEKYYQEAHAIIYVIDAAAASSFEDAKSALGFSWSSRLQLDPDFMNVRLFLMFKDLPGVITDEELARYLQLKELDERPYMFQAVSAYDGRGIKSGIDWVVEQMERSKRTEVLRARAGLTGQI
uniref:Uncharacterized protein n=1 Tax=Oryza punctata TaxID=4537 RepID=A0A0E0KEL1_ORYPU